MDIKDIYRPIVSYMPYTVSIGERMKRIFLVILSLLITAGMVNALTDEPSHLDKMKNPKGCSACHKGRGKRGTPMLNEDKTMFCFRCHGSDNADIELRAKTDILSVFRKRSRHPVIETSHYHLPTEELPEKSPSAPRHVACQDCHSTHFVTPENKFKKVSGYSKAKIKKKEATEEYEVCFKCHSDSANLPTGSSNMALLMSPSNPSYHPVIAPGRNAKVVSLIPPLTVASTIKCTDCHNNNDPGGPSGPHGSDYDYILIADYPLREIPESQSAYELCYNCHRRESILSNESFKKHKEHIVYNHTPCSACHTPHGSRANPHLIEFNTDFVLPSPLPQYIPSPDGRPLCYLTCHAGGKDVLHDTQFYRIKNWR